MDATNSNFVNPHGTGCGWISVSVYSWNQIVWWLLHCSACWWGAWSCVTYKPQCNWVSKV